MTKTTEWEIRFNEIFPGDVATMEEDGIHARITSSLYNRNKLKDFISKEIESARREVHPTINGFCCACDYDIEFMKHDREFDIESLKKTCSYCGVINSENIKTHKGIDGHTYYHVGYNQAIDDVLATLRKEEKV